MSKGEAGTHYILLIKRQEVHGRRVVAGPFLEAFDSRRSSNDAAFVEGQAFYPLDDR